LGIEISILGCTWMNGVPTPAGCLSAISTEEEKRSRGRGIMESDLREKWMSYGVRLIGVRVDSSFLCRFAVQVTLECLASIVILCVGASMLYPNFQPILRSEHSDKRFSSPPNSFILAHTPADPPFFFSCIAGGSMTIPVISRSRHSITGGMLARGDPRARRRNE